MPTVNPANHRLSCQTGVGSEYTTEESEMLRAVETYRLKHGLRFMSATDILKAIWSIGYRKTPLTLPERK